MKWKDIMIRKKLKIFKLSSEHEEEDYQMREADPAIHTRKDVTQALVFYVKRETFDRKEPRPKKHSFWAIETPARRLLDVRARSKAFGVYRQMRFG